MTIKDGALAVVLAAALAVQATAIAGTWGGGYWVSGAVVGALVSAAALLRRRHLLAAAIAGLAVAATAVPLASLAGLPREPSPATAIALAVLVGAAARTLPAGPAGAVVAGGLAVVAGAWLTGWFTGVATFATLAWLAGVATGLGLRLRDGHHRTTTEAVRRDERLALARELHDVVAHHITGIVLQAQATRIVARTRPDEVDGALAGIEAAGSEALTAMRRLVGLLRDADDAAPATPGPEGLAALVARFGGDGPAVRLRLPDHPTPWPPEVTTTVYRIVQEALTNVARHAPHAASVTVDVAHERDAVTVEVADDAPPAPVRRPHRTGYGLVGMHERVEALGGTLRAGPRPGTGWSVRATLPITARPIRSSPPDATRSERAAGPITARSDRAAGPITARSDRASGPITAREVG